MRYFSWRQAALMLGLQVMLTSADGYCPRCAQIEAERAAHPSPSAGYYDEEHPSTGKETPSSAKQPQNSNSS